MCLKRKCLNENQLALIHLEDQELKKRVHMYWFGLTKSNLDFWMIFGKINSAVEKSRGWHLHSFVGVGLVRYLMIRQDTYSRNQISMGG